MLIVTSYNINILIKIIKKTDVLIILLKKIWSKSSIYLTIHISFFFF